jgi:hypothetical protein
MPLMLEMLVGISEAMTFIKFARQKDGNDCTRLLA